MSEFDGWLESQGLGKYRQVFAENDVDFDVLDSLTENDLRELGLSLGDRRRLRVAVRAGSAPADTPAEAVPDAEVAVDAADGEADAQATVGDRRQVAVLFADLSGFTALSSKRDAEEVHALLSAYFDAVDEAIGAFGGTIDKHIGDGVMALFGAPVAHANDPERAVRAAREIHRRLTAFDPPLVAHIGIACGSVVATRTGSARFDEYTVTGASVNLASRLQDLAEPGETMISDIAWQAVNRLFEGEWIGKVTVKGFPARVPVWRVGEPRAVAPVDEAEIFVGRRRELCQLRGILDDCSETGIGQVVLVRGEPGIGKSGLIDRFQREAAAEGMVGHAGLVFDFATEREREAIPTLLAGLLGTAPGENEEVRLAAARRAAEAQWIAADDLVHLIDALALPLPPDLRAFHDAMDNRTRTAGRRRVVAGLIEARSRNRPTMLRVEDIHWADRELVEQLAEIARVVADCPVLLVLTTRIENDPIDAAWRAGVRDSPLTTIDLGPLRETEAVAMAGHHPGASEALMKACVARAAGNPLFLDQLLRNTENAGADEVPGSVQSIVQMRLDNLEPADRSALQAASVLGQRFAPDAVAAMVRNPAYRCTALVALRLVRTEGDELLFVHALVRDGVYGSLLRESRRELHRAAAAYYEERDAVLYAAHLESADDPRAVAAYLAAARDAYTVHRYDRAIELSRRGLSLEAPGNRRFALTCLLGEALRVVGDAPASIARYAEALAMADTPRAEYGARLGLANGMRIVDRFDDAFAEVDRADAIASEFDDPEFLSEVAHLRGNLCFPLGQIDKCREAHEQAIAHARRSGRTDHEVQALGGLGDANYAQGRVRSANASFAECVERARANGFTRIEVANLPMVAFTTLLMGDYAEARRLAQAAADAAERVGNERAAIIAYNTFVALANDQGDIEGARRAGARIVALSRTLGATRFESYGLAMQGWTEMLAGDLATARDVLERALALARASTMGFCGPWILSIMAQVAADRDQAFRCLAEGDAILEAGAVAHNHHFFRRDAIDVCLQHADRDGVDRQIAAWQAYVADERTPWTDFFLARAAALRAVAAAESGAELRAELDRLIAVADTMALRGHDLALRAASVQAG